MPTDRDTKMAPDATAEAKKITSLDHQLDKGAAGAAAELYKDYNQVLTDNGGNVAEAQKWLKDTTAALAKAGVLPDITIGFLSNEKDILSSDGEKITQRDIAHDNFYLSGSTGAHQSFDAVFTDMLANNTNGLTDSVNTALGAKDGTYTDKQFSEFTGAQEDAAVKAAKEAVSRDTDTGLFAKLPGTNITVLQYLDTAQGANPDGKISRDDIKAALANPLLPDSIKGSIQALQQQLKDNDWNNRSVTDIFKQDGITIPDGTATDWNSIYQASIPAFTKANDDYKASLAS